jgi:hypothetical protein
VQVCAIDRKLISKLFGQYFKTLARIERDVLPMLQSIIPPILSKKLHTVARDKVTEHERRGFYAYDVGVTLRLMNVASHQRARPSGARNGAERSHGSKPTSKSKETMPPSVSSP